MTSLEDRIMQFVRKYYRAGNSLLFAKELAKHLEPSWFVKAGDNLIYIPDIMYVDMFELETHHRVTLNTRDGVFTARGFDAIEAVMMLKPSALEGRRGLKWRKNAWAFHNLIGHPIVQILSWMGMKKKAVRFHDWTTPAPRGFRKY